LRISIVTGFFLPVPAVSGGATERSWYGLAKLFAAQGHSVTFISRRSAESAVATGTDGVTHIRVRGFDHTRNMAINLVLDFIWGIRVAVALPVGDVVICNTITLPVWLNRLKPSAGKVSVMIGRNPKGQVPFYRAVTRIYVPSTFVLSLIRGDWATSRTKVIGYPIDWGLHAGSSHQSASPVTVGFIGRLHREKGIAMLIHAALILSKKGDLPPWRLRIVGPHLVTEGGDGSDWFEALKKESQSLGNLVEWMGPEFDSKALARIYGGMDIFCYPSIAERGETFGVAIAEAMAAKCAVVVSALACFSDLVVDGETGLVFEHAADSPEVRLAACIERLVRDEGLRNSLAVNGQQKATRYDYPRVSQNVLDDIADFAGTSGPKAP
jgi:glycosyltransferase involved in cell wall biosynthesis